MISTAFYNEKTNKVTRLTGCNFFKKIKADKEYKCLINGETKEMNYNEVCAVVLSKAAESCTEFVSFIVAYK